jgi:hypothetical protein
MQSFFCGLSQKTNVALSHYHENTVSPSKQPENAEAATFLQTPYFN